jgi:hypothetical protein
MSTYAIPGVQGTVSPAYKSVVGSWGSTTLKRIKWYEIVFGAAALPNAIDCYIQVDISRFTTTTGLAGTAFTPNPTDPADGPALAVSAINFTTDPVVTANSSLLNFGVNQRNTTRWIQNEEAKFLIIPATAQAGLALRVTSSTFGSSIQSTVTFLE